MNKLAPSILSADFAALGEDVKKAEQAGAQYLHIDVMDGAFVPSLSLGFPVIQSIRKLTDMVFDVHLMICDPDRYIAEFAAAGADIITVHAEACPHLNRTIAAIKEQGVKAGVVLNPATPLTELEYILEDLDMVLLMTVNPGFGGQKYIESCTRKIQDLRKMITERGLDIDIEVDGGIKLNNVQKVLDAGANVIVAGSAVFGGDVEQNVKDFLEVLNA
ncbi:ribulose-phosphate 3-epimerase [Candidatus Merdisoma sp. JLR.KK006]|uniref:ribulose-phosphate 3-epimerase n=1 Tax=Candidatus Merdisoma sp. JLR.KK006 TaxID=3112626 RepID=UPI002FF26E52